MPPSSSSGNGTITYSATANSGPPRSGTITVAGQTHTVNQDSGSCVVTPIAIGSVIKGDLTTTDCRSQFRGSSFADHYSFSGTAGQEISILLTSTATAFDSYLFLVGPDGGLLKEDDDGGGNLNSRIPATSGFISLPLSGTYIIEATSLGTNSTGVYTLTLAAQTPPANDNLVNAQALSGPSGTVYGSNVGATKEPGEPNHAGNVGGKSVWYRWQSPSDGSVRFNTFGSNFDTLLAVYKGSSVGGLTLIATNDNDSYYVRGGQVTFSATAGTVYQIAVDGWADAYGNGAASGKLTLNWTPPPANNDFANAQVITGSTGSVTGTSVLTNKEAGEPNHAGNSGGKSVWYRWQAPSDGSVTFTTGGSSFDTLLGVYTGSSVSNLTLIASDDDERRSYGILTSKLTFNAVSGTVYQIAVDGKSGASGNITLTWSIPSTNDNFANAQVITGGSGIATGNNELATKEPGEPDHAGKPGYKSLWHRWQAPVDGKVTFTTNGSRFDTLLGVYTGSSVSNLTLIGSNDNASGNDGTSKVVFSAVSGTVYQIAVDGCCDSGNIVLSWGPTPANDDFANAQVITGSSGSVAGSNVLATKESYYEPDHAGNFGGNSVWYRWQAPSDGNVMFTTNGSNFDTLLGVYTGSDVNNLTLIGSNDDDRSAVRTSKVAFSAVSGTVYQISVDGYGGASGSINLDWSLSIPTPITVQFSASGYNVQESDGSATITVTRSGDTSGNATVAFATSDGTAQQRSDYSTTAGTLSFGPGVTSKTFTVLITDDAYVEGNETVNLTLSNSTGAILNSPATVVLTIIDNDTLQPTANPADDARFFVQEQYYDFLNRTPDQSGWDYWTGQITQCGSDQNCIRAKRIDVSNAFYFELEFQQTGAYVYRLYRAAYGNNQPFPNPDNTNQPEAKKLPSYAVFVQDRARVVGGANLPQSQLDLANAFVQRPEFLAKYAANLDGPSFIDALLNTIKNDSGVDLTAQKSALVTLFNQGGRGAVLYRLADDNIQTNPINNRAFIDAEYNRAFVATQYFGYLRRNSDIGGFLFWLGQVSSAPLRNTSKQHAMVCSFITSAEYQQRFSSVVTHTNAECPQ